MTWYESVQKALDTYINRSARLRSPRLRQPLCRSTRPFRSLFALGLVLLEAGDVLVGQVEGVGG